MMTRFLSVLLLGLFFLPSLVLADPASDQQAALQAQLDAVNAQIAQNEVQLAGKQKKRERRSSVMSRFSIIKSLRLSSKLSNVTLPYKSCGRASRKKRQVFLRWILKFQTAKNHFQKSCAKRKKSIIHLLPRDF